jgi:hypothetical protein
VAALAVALVLLLLERLDMTVVPPGSRKRTDEGAIMTSDSARQWSSSVGAKMRKGDVKRSVGDELLRKQGARNSRKRKRRLGGVRS